MSEPNTSKPQVLSQGVQSTNKKISVKQLKTIIEEYIQQEKEQEMEQWWTRKYLWRCPDY